MTTSHAGTRLTRRSLLKVAGVTTAGTAVAASRATNVAAAPPAAIPVAVRVGPPAGAAETTLTQVTVNGTLYEAAVDTRWTLLEVLRDQLGMTGTKHGCFRGECGACTVIVDGRNILSCATLAVEVAGKKVTTVESLAEGGKLNTLQQAFWDSGSAQCGYCTPGMLMSSTALLATNPKPTEDEIRHALSGNLCRCTGYRKIVEGVLVASGQAPK